MRRSSFAVALILAAVSCTAARADPVTYTLSGTMSAVLENAAGTAVGQITDQSFTWTVTANTASFSSITTHGGTTLETPAITDTITIGTTRYSPSGPTVFAFEAFPATPGFSSVPLGIGGFVDPTALLGIAWHAQGLFTYDPRTFLDPYPVVFDNAGALPLTTGTSLMVNSAAGLLFSATVPEPASLPVLATALGLLLGALGLTRRLR